MRLQPPDILLTNYKMLDYLIIRPADAPIWKDDGTETLKYIVVDELHTFDGAQGTDLACLLRRLKARLKVPAGASVLCWVHPQPWVAWRIASDCGSTPARSLESPSTPMPLWASPCYSRRDCYGQSLIDMTSRVPEPEQADDLQAEHFAEVHAYLQRQAELWCNMARQDVGSPAWRLALGRPPARTRVLPQPPCLAQPSPVHHGRTRHRHRTGCPGGRQGGPRLLVWPTRQHAGVDIDRIGAVCGRWRTPTFFAGTSATLDAGVAAPGLTWARCR